MDFKTIKPKAIFIIAFIFHLNGFSQNLENHKWQARVLIIKTTDSTSSIYINQLKEFKNSFDELNERKLIVYHIVNSKYSAISYINSERKSGIVSNQLHKNILNSESHFEVLLIGLDGGVKLKQDKVVSKTELFALIDSMPMRKNEIKN